MDAPTPIEPDSALGGIDPQAIVLGTIVDIGASFFLGAAVAMSFVSERAEHYGDEIPESFFRDLATDPSYLMWSAVVGAACTAIGGFVAARRAGRFHAQHGAVVAVVSIAIAVLLAVLPGGLLPSVGYQLLTVFVTLVGGVLGGAIAGWTSGRAPTPDA